MLTRPRMLTGPCVHAESAVAEAWGPGGPRVLGFAERSEAAAVLELLLSSSLQVLPPDAAALRYVARTAALIEVLPLLYMDSRPCA